MLTAAILGHSHQPDRIQGLYLCTCFHYTMYPSIYSLAFLSGPSFATEVGQEQPTAVTIASVNEPVAKEVQEIMSTVRFRCYTTGDVVGVEFGGALKNVLAIACGISDGLGFGCNARAALMTRGANFSNALQSLYHI